MEQITDSLNNYWNSFLQNLPRLAIAIIIIALGFLLSNFIKMIFRRRLMKKSHDPLMTNFLSKAIQVIIVVAMIMLSLYVAGLNGIAGALLATAGASAVVLGFAFKDIGENFLAGIILAFNRPFHVNDTIEIGEIFGKIKDMQFRYTKIKTFDGKDVYIPNADVLTKPVINYTEDGFLRWDFIVGIAYENDIEQAKNVINKVLETHIAIVHDGQHINFVAEEELAASTVNLKVYFWVGTTDFRSAALVTRGEVIKMVKTKLEENGFNLPAEIRELKFYQDSKKFPVNIFKET